MMTKHLPAFQQYQKAFTQRIRNPSQHRVPKDVEATRMAVYETLIFNNLLESVSLCFPVAQSVLGDDAWQQLVRRYFSDYASNTPIFREIPETFVTFLAEQQNETLPPFLLSLCHYEWIELSLSTQPEDEHPEQLLPIESPETLLKQPVAFISPMVLLQYDYAVHTISAKNQTDVNQATQLLVYKDKDDEIQFVVLNAMTYALIKHLSEEQVSSEAALSALSEQLNQPKEAVIGFGLQLLADFYQQGIIKGCLA